MLRRWMGASAALALALTAACSSDAGEGDDDQASSSGGGSSSGSQAGSSSSSGGSSSSSGGSSSSSGGSSSSSSSGGASSSSGGPTCEADLSTFAERADVTCLQENCCESASACADDPTCVATDVCFTECWTIEEQGPRNACVQQCIEDAGGEVPSTYSDYAVCVEGAPSMCALPE